MKKAISVLNRIISIILIALLLFAGYVFITVMRAGKDKVPSVFGYSFLQVATGSMEPTIPTRSMIIVRQTDAKDVKVGDVITFYSNDPLIINLPNTHRVTAIAQENGAPVFTTRGDASDTDDPYTVPADRLIGVYVRYFEVGKLPEILHSRYFFFFVLLVPLCVVILLEIMRVKKSAEAKAKAEAEEIAKAKAIEEAKAEAEAILKARAQAEAIADTQKEETHDEQS